jgi:hypothetical protein
MGWTYLNYYEPLFLPIGLSILILYASFGKILEKSTADSSTISYDEKSGPDNKYTK